MSVARAAGLALLMAPALVAGADEELGHKVFTHIAQPPCAICHTLQAAGAAGTVGPSLDELKPDKARVMDVVRGGSGPMPSYADKLTPEQIEAVAAYVAKASQAP